MTQNLVSGLSVHIEFFVPNLAPFSIFVDFSIWSGGAVEPKSRIKKRVLLKNVKHDAGFPTFQKKILHIKPCIGNNVL